MTIWCMCIACWIPHSEYVTLVAFPLQRWLHKCGSVLHYTYIACLVYIKVKCLCACSLHFEDGQGVQNQSILNLDISGQFNARAFLLYVSLRQEANFGHCQSGYFDEKLSLCFSQDLISPLFPVATSLTEHLHSCKIRTGLYDANKCKTGNYCLWG